MGTVHIIRTAILNRQLQTGVTDSKSARGKITARLWTVTIITRHTRLHP
jgi:hypothetical protein